MEPADTVPSVVADYRATWERVDAVVSAAPSLDAQCAEVGNDTPVNLRWVMSHLLEETARHAGHADILRELLDGETGRYVLLLLRRSVAGRSGSFALIGGIGGKKTSGRSARRTRVEEINPARASPRGWREAGSSRFASSRRIEPS